MSTTDTLSPLQTELLSRADSIFESIANAVNKATTFAAEQIPDIAMQYVAYGRATTSAYIAIGLIVFIIGTWLFVRVGIMNSRKYPLTHSWDDRRSGAVMAGIPMSVIGSSMILKELNAFLMVWFAPKIWLLTELAHLIKR